MSSINEKINPLLTIKETECACSRCQAMCKRPCFGTPEDIEKLIEAGYGNRLCVDWHCGLDKYANITILAPALKGHEGKKAPLFPMSDEGCTFFKEGKCELHDKKLKPTQGRLAHHSYKPTENEPSGGVIGANCSEAWKSDKGKALVEKWAANHEINTEREGDAGSLVEFLVAAFGAGGRGRDR